MAANETSTRVRIRAVPGSRRAELVGRYGDAWKLRVTAAPEKGRANAELCSYLAGVLLIPTAAISVVAGTASRDKVVQVTGLDAARVDALLAAACSAGM